MSLIFSLGSFLDDGDHTPAQLQEHLLLLGSQAVMIGALMEQRIAGILGTAGQVIQRYLQNLCDIEKQSQAGFSCAALNMANGFHCHTDLLGQFIGIHLLHFSGSAHFLSHQNRTDMQSFGPTDICRSPQGGNAETYRKLGK